MIRLLPAVLLAVPIAYFWTRWIWKSWVRRAAFFGTMLLLESLAATNGGDWMTWLGILLCGAMLFFTLWTVE